MMRTEPNLSYRPRSLSFSYGREQCQHPKMRPVGLHEAKNLLRNNRTLLFQNEIESPSDEKPTLPNADGEEEERKIQILEDITARFELNDGQLKKIEKRMIDEIHRGLNKNTNKTANIKSFVTYVTQLPTGEESGKYLALDLGGTNFRVIVVEITSGCRSIRMQSTKHAVSEKLMRGPGSDLFDFMVNILVDFLKSNNLLEEATADYPFHLGFTFSFPTQQQSLDEAKLSGWTKGYTCEGVQGVDVGQLLKNAIAKRPELHVEVNAILNDTTGCLIAGAYKHPHCRIGIIVGTGTNAAYVENLDIVDMYEGDRPSNNEVVINTEWGAFGNTGSLDIVRTIYDYELDRNSLNPGKQIFEKLISGMYLGELTRLAIVDAIDKEIVHFPKEVFERKGIFDTRHISEIESDRINSFNNLDGVLIELGIDPNPVTNFDRKILRYICQCVSFRAANLAGAGVAALANKIGRPRLTVGMDGSVYKFHPCFGRIMKAVARRLTSDNIDFDVVLAEDGSGRGAALAVAAAVTIR